jgi:glycosyltransferase involved in cell wall biosynthesis
MPPDSVAGEKVGYLLYGTEGAARAAENVGYYHRADKLREAAEQRGFLSDVAYSRRKAGDRSLLKRIWKSDWIRDRFGDSRCLYCASADTAAMGVRALRGTTVPVLYDIHTPPVGEKWLQFKLSKSLRNFAVYLEVCIAESMAIKRSDYILWSSLVQYAYYLKRGFPRERLREVRHGVDLERFIATPVPTDAPRLVAYAGTMVPYQGADKLIAAFRSLPAGTIRLKMIGFSENEAALRREADAAGIETVPQIPQTEVAEHLSGATCTTIIAHPDNRKYKNGAAPTKWPESLALGKPLLSMDVYDTAQLIRELQVGWVVANSVEALADGMRTLAACPPDELTAMGTRARAEAERNYAWPVIGDKFAAVLREAERR